MIVLLDIYQVLAIYQVEGDAFFLVRGAILRNKSIYSGFIKEH